MLNDYMFYIKPVNLNLTIFLDYIFVGCTLLDFNRNSTITFCINPMLGLFRFFAFDTAKQY